jgi:dolichyl-phosphate-mannose--protein O-mannosyl transferase
MFLYHYLSALIFAILALAYFIDPAHARISGASRQKNRRNIIIGALIIAGLAFLYFAPLSYGLPLSPSAFQNRIWLPTWQ